MFAATSLCIVSTFASLSPGDWPQYNGPHHDRAGAGTLSSTGWQEQAPQEVWRTSASTGFSSFCVGGGRAFTLEERAGRETLIAYSAESGEPLWSARLGKADYDGGGDKGADGNDGGDGPRSTPAFADGRVYALDAHLHLACLDASSGESLWRVNVRKDYDGQELKWGNAASPVLASGRVLLAGGGKDQTFLAFDAATGVVAWKRGDEDYTHATPAVATIHGVEQVLFLVQSGLVSLRVEDGAELWRAEYPYRVSSAASPVVDGELVYVSAGYGVGAGTFRIEHTQAQGWNAHLLWQQRNDLMNHWSTPVALDGKLYGLYGFKKYGTAPLACIDMETGQTHWEQKGFGPGGLIRVGEDLLVLGDAGQLVRVAVNPDSYRERGRLEALSGKCWSSPAYSDGHVFLRSTREGVCLQLPQ